jgi:two-component system invasion response regulator UvrY
MINVLLVDDHELVRTGIEHLLRDIEDIEVVGMARTGEEAISQVDRLKPDIVLMDINMPGIGGIEASRKIYKKYPDTKIIALSVYAEGPYPQQLMTLGACGFISKNCHVTELIEAIRTVHGGKRYLSADVASEIALSHIPGIEHLSPFDQLSQRELQIAIMTLQGRQIQEIGDMLMISAKTVSTYRHRLYKKLGVKNDVELMRLSMKFNLMKDAF